MIGVVFSHVDNTKQKLKIFMHIVYKLKSIYKVKNVQKKHKIIKKQFQKLQNKLEQAGENSLSLMILLQHEHKIHISFEILQAML